MKAINAYKKSNPPIRLVPAVEAGQNGQHLDDKLLKLKNSRG